MNSKIKIGDRVKIAFATAVETEFNLPEWAVSRRRNNVTGTVVSPISAQETESWWVQHDTVPASRQCKMRKPEAADPVVTIARSRYEKAPYQVLEMTIIR